LAVDHLATGGRIKPTGAKGACVNRNWKQSKESYLPLRYLVWVFSY